MGYLNMSHDRRRRLHRIVWTVWGATLVLLVGLFVAVRVFSG